MSNDDEINELLAEIELNDEDQLISPLSTVPLDSVTLDEGTEATENKKEREEVVVETEIEGEKASVYEPQPASSLGAAQPGPAGQPTSQPATSVQTGSQKSAGAGEAGAPAVPVAQPTALGKRPPIPDEVKEAASMAAAVTREAAADVAKEFSKISNQAQSFFSNMWQQFDPLAANGQTGGGPEAIDVKQRFGILSETEKLLESFRCTLIQTYAPSDNTFTPIKAIGFTGCFHILDSNVAFEFDNVASNGKPIVIPLSEVSEVERDPANGGSLVCRLVGGRTFCVGRFVHGALELDSAEQLLRSRR